MNSRSKFPRRVRIHGGECGAVARALHHETKSLSLSAVVEKVFSTTNERKSMSKKTFFKRIALTAIAALGFGMLSVTSSNAIVTAHSLTIDAATDAIKLGESATATLTHSFVNLTDANDSVTLRAVVTSANASQAGTIMMSVVDSYTSTANSGASADSPKYGFGSAPGTNAVGTLLTSNYADTRDSMTIAPSTSAVRTQGSSIQLKLYNPTAAGTYVVTVFTTTSDAGAAPVSSTPSVTWTVTVTAPDKTAHSSSTVTLRTGDGVLSDGVEGVDSSTLYNAYDAAATDTAPEATIIVNQKSAISTNTAQESFTVTIVGEAWVTASTVALRPTAGNGVKVLTFAYPTAGTPVAVDIWST